MIAALRDLKAARRTGFAPSRSHVWGDFGIPHYNFFARLIAAIVSRPLGGPADRPLWRFRIARPPGHCAQGDGWLPLLPPPLGRPDEIQETRRWRRSNFPLTDRLLPCRGGSFRAHTPLQRDKRQSAAALLGDYTQKSSTPLQELGNLTLGAPRRNTAFFGSSSGRGCALSNRSCADGCATPGGLPTSGRPLVGGWRACAPAPRTYANRVPPAATGSSALTHPLTLGASAPYSYVGSLAPHRCSPSRPRPFRAPGSPSVDPPA